MSYSETTLWLFATLFSKINLMRFKEPHLETQLKECPLRVQDVAKVFALIFREETARDAVVTRVYDPVKGESGIHLQKLAVDFRDETSDGQDLASEEQTARICERMNRLFPRSDKRLTCIHHTAAGGPRHFHVQVERKTV
jgi:hypothetical protein